MAQHVTSADLPALEEPRPGWLNIQYAPADGADIHENPPRFTWLPVLEDGAEYVLKIDGDGVDRVYDALPLNFHTPDDPLPPGRYTWSYAVWKDGARATAWSTARSFEIAEGLPETPLAPRATRFSDADMAHPRMWLGPKELKKFRADLAADPGHCGWPTFFEKSVVPWLDRPVMAEPAPYPNNTRVAKIWRQTYVDCQELIYAIRHLAIAGQVLEDADLVAKAKLWLLEAATWDPNGTTSRAYTDEWAYRVVLALAWGYDWLYEHLSEEERTLVRKALLARTRQVSEHAIQSANIHLFPFDSHAVRSVSSVMVPCCLAMLGEEPEAEEWLNFAVEFLATVYSPWGDTDGGWAEGPHYWMTGIAYLIDAANLLRSFADIDLYKRPFFQATADFPLYTKAPDTRRATFGDDSTMGDLACLKLGYNTRQFAGITGNKAYQWYFEEICRTNPGTEMASYNWGWWDLTFDSLVYAHDFPSVPAEPPGPEDRLRWFKGIGWAAIQTDMANPDGHIQFVMKSSPFGSVSHSHGDQNAFCLAGFGEDLAIQSGHYIAFNSSMHREWRRQTRSKNAILIDGKGQYADRDKARAIKASGQIEVAEERDDHIFIMGDATAAYQSLTPSVTGAVRKVYFAHNSYFVIVDEVDAEEPVSIEWLLHANAPMDLSDTTFRYTGETAGFYGAVLWSEAGPATLSQVTGFPGVDPSEIEGLPVSTCLTAAYPKAKCHRIATLLVPYSLKAPKRIFHFLDDQGYDCELYFSDAEDRSFRVVVEKSFKV